VAKSPTKKRGGIMHRLGRAVGNVAAGYARETDAVERRDAQRAILAVMADEPDATDEKVARLAKKRLARDHGEDDPRLDWASPPAVGRLRRALAVAALERRKGDSTDEGDDE
jgi:hypothetical protein